MTLGALLWKEFYVYTYWRRDGSQWVPFYVGKGQGKRSSIRKGRSPEFLAALGELKRQRRSPRITFEYHASEADTFSREVALIAQYGRLDKGTGTLVNKTAGGEGMREIWFTEKMRNAARAQMLLLRSRDEVEAKRKSAAAAAQSTERTRAARSKSLKLFYRSTAEIERRKAISKKTWLERTDRQKHADAISASWKVGDRRERTVAGIKKSLAEGGAVRRSETLKERFQTDVGEVQRRIISQSSTSMWAREGHRLSHKIKMLEMWVRRHLAAGRPDKAAECARRAEILRQTKDPS